MPRRGTLCSNISAANELAGSQSGSQHRPAPSDVRLRPATVIAGSRHTGRRLATGRPGMACKRSGVRIPYAPPPGQRPVETGSRSSGSKMGSKTRATLVFMGSHAGGAGVAGTTKDRSTRTRPRAAGTARSPSATGRTARLGGGTRSPAVPGPRWPGSSGNSRPSRIPACSLSAATRSSARRTTGWHKAWMAGRPGQRHSTVRY